MHTYRKTPVRAVNPATMLLGDDIVFTVGLWVGGDAWHPMKEFKTDYEAAAYVSYLNGGKHPKE